MLSMHLAMFTFTSLRRQAKTGKYRAIIVLDTRTVRLKKWSWVQVSDHLGNRGHPYGHQPHWALGPKIKYHALAEHPQTSKYDPRPADQTKDEAHSALSRLVNLIKVSPNTSDPTDQKLSVTNTFETLAVLGTNA
ncbi:hypothetical protein PSPO01_11510 [Paraphaeosphaeria sporulosa]